MPTVASSDMDGSFARDDNIPTMAQCDAGSRSHPHHQSENSQPARCSNIAATSVGTASAILHVASDVIELAVADRSFAPYLFFPKPGGRPGFEGVLLARWRWEGSFCFHAIPCSRRSEG